MTLTFKRRFFLAGAGGALVSLPFLTSLAPRSARAADGALPFWINFLQVFGVQQTARFGGPHAGESEGFWPDVPLTDGSFATLSSGSFPELGASDRALHELRGLEQHLAVVRGIRMNETTSGHHETRRAQLLTGSAQTYDRPDRVVDHHSNAWGRHESIDWRLCRELDGSRPIHCSKNVGSFQVTFDPSLASEHGLTNPATLYDQFFRIAGESSTAPARRALATDVVAAELQSLRADTRLSSADRVKLERHFDLLRDVETHLTCMPPEEGSSQFDNLRRAGELVPEIRDGVVVNHHPRHETREETEVTALAFMEVLALGASCNAFRFANLCAEGVFFAHSDIFPEGAERDAGFPSWYHNISHRTLSTMDGEGQWSGVGIAEHRRVDRWYARRFRFLVQRLLDLGVLDDGVCSWTNEISTGAHEATDMPVVLAGNCGGRLRNGLYVDLHGPAAAGTHSIERLVPNNRLLNTVAAAMGVRGDDGGPIADFGGVREDGSRDEGGFVDELVGF